MNNWIGTKYNLIAALFLAHLVIDLYCNVLPLMIPYLITFMGLSVLQSTILVSFYTFSASLIQPFIGYYLDYSKNTSMVYFSILWMSLLLGVSGFVHNYFILLIIVTLAGLGSAAFHPQASSLIHELSGSRKAFTISVFAAVGNIGFALAPLLLIPMFDWYGLSSSFALIIPGVLIAFFLLILTPKKSVSEPSLPNLSKVFSSLLGSSRQLVAIIGVISLRSLSYVGLITIFPLYFKSISISSLTGSRLLFVMLIAGVIGGIVGGHLSDLYGPRRIIVISLFLTTPFFLAFYYTEGFFSAVMLGIAGALLLASFSVTIVAAQETIPDYKSLAAGLTMGFAAGIGSLGLMPIGWLADSFGLSAALFVLFCLPVIASGIGLAIRNNGYSNNQEPRYITGNSQ